MRRSFFTLIVCAISLTGMCQGKVNLINDAASLVFLFTDTSLLKAADRPQSGQAVGNLTPLFSGTTLVAGLYGGTSSSSLFLYSTVTLTDQGTPGGYIPGTHIVLNAQPNGAPAIPGIANGTPIGASTPWFQVKVWDATYATCESALSAGAYATFGREFQFNPGPSLSYPNTAPAGVNSTWTDGPFWIPIPEPSTTALVGLSAAVLIAFRRRQ